MLTQVEYHRTLKRLISKHFGTEILSKETESFLQSINDSFLHYERDRELMERALELTSSELTQANLKIREEKRIVQERLTESEQILKSINQNLNEAVFRITHEGEIIYTNNAFAKLFGQENGELPTTMNFKDLFEEQEKWRDIKQEAEAKGGLKGVEVIFKKADNSHFWGLVSIMSSLGHGYTLHFDGSIVDISKQKKSEENVRNANLLLIKTNKELDRFVYSASHDLKAPLSSLLGLINVIELDNPSNLHLYLDKMRTSIHKLDAFIKEIIDYSYNSSKKAVNEEVNLKELFEESYEQYKYLSNATKINLITDWKQKKPVFSDPRRIKIILNNLVSNAIMYSNPEVVEPYIKVSTETVDNNCVMTIEDNGIGIGTEHLNKIFEMFYRGTNVSGGSGLGLYIVKETIAKLQGNISVNSEENKGTTFKITLPNQPAPSSN
jgi:PAS domain S-box-containing protein